jgi:hypothetical protein
MERALQIWALYMGSLKGEREIWNYVEGVYPHISPFSELTLMHTRIQYVPKY